MSVPPAASLANLLGSLLNARPVFTEEGPQFYQRAFARNRQFAKPGPYQTALSPMQEAAFRLWVAKNNIPFDTGARTVDYDMRGYWLANAGRAPTAREPNGEIGFTDTFKTPYDTTFSAESKYATPNNPFRWGGPGGNSLLDTRSGQTIFRRSA
jgi:hypothetical protein